MYDNAAVRDDTDEDLRSCIIGQGSAQARGGTLSLFNSRRLSRGEDSDTGPEVLSL